jgi:hypothetical protein
VSETSKGDATTHGRKAVYKKVYIRTKCEYITQDMKGRKLDIFASEEKEQDITFPFVVNVAGGATDSVIRIDKLKRRVSRDIKAPYGLLKVGIILDEEESDDDGDMPFVDPIKGLPNKFACDERTLYHITVEPGLGSDYPENMTPTDLDRMGWDLCEQYFYLQFHRVNPLFEDNPRVFIDSINDEWEEQNLAETILKYRKFCPKKWFTYVHWNGSNPFIKASFCRDDIATKMMDLGMVDKQMLNSKNNCDGSALSGAILTGSYHLGIKILRRKDLDLHTVTRTGAYSLGNNIKLVYERYHQRKKKNDDIRKEEKRHRDLVINTMDDFARQGNGNFLEADRLRDRQIQVKKVYGNTRTMPLTNEYAPIYDEIYKFLIKRGEEPQDYIEDAQFPPPPKHDDRSTYTGTISRMSSMVSSGKATLEQRDKKMMDEFAKEIPSVENMVNETNPITYNDDGIALRPSLIESNVNDGEILIMANMNDDNTDTKSNTSKKSKIFGWLPSIFSGSTKGREVGAKIADPEDEEGRIERDEGVDIVEGSVESQEPDDGPYYDEHVKRREKEKADAKKKKEKKDKKSGKRKLGKNAK